MLTLFPLFMHLYVCVTVSGRVCVLSKFKVTVYTLWFYVTITIVCVVLCSDVSMTTWDPEFDCQVRQSQKIWFSSFLIKTALLGIRKSARMVISFPSITLWDYVSSASLKLKGRQRCTSCTYGLDEDYTFLCIILDQAA